jgi:ribosomal protein L37AE/L43A
MHRNTEVAVNCPVCNHNQKEINLAPNDKFAWQCDNCQAVIEGDTVHPLQESAIFCLPRNGKGNICTGFGGGAGAIFP